jgi:signal transduction histidine kinase
VFPGIPLWYYAASGALNFVTSASLLLLVGLKGSKSKSNQVFALFCFAVAQWGFFYFLWLSSQDPDNADFFLRTCMFGVIFMPSLFTHFIVSFLDIRLHPSVIRANYIISLILATLVYTPLYAVRGEAFLVFPYWAKPGILFPLHLIHFAVNVLYSHYKMAEAIKRTRGIMRNQIKYIFIGTTIGYLAGVTNYFCWYRIPIPPVPNMLISLYVVSVAYAIMKYRLMDVKVAAVRAFAFMAVYIPVLAAPFLLAAAFRDALERAFRSEWWIAPVALSNLLAPLGIYLYLKLKNRAEEIVLHEQRRYQATLLQASQGMTLIKELGQLLKLIVHVAARTMRLKDAAIFLLDKNSATYTLKAIRYPSRTPKGISIRTEDPIVLHLMHTRAPVLLEEIKTRLIENSGSSGADLRELELRMKELNIAVVVPSFIHEVLVGFLILGEKSGGHMYTQDDLSVLGVMANQSALAVENALFYEERGKSLAEQFHDEKLKSLGKMGSDMSHQVNNRLNIILGAANLCGQMFLPKLKEELDKGSAGDPSKLLQSIERQIKSIEDNAVRGGEIAQAIMRFARKSAVIKLDPMHFVDALKGAQTLLSVRYEKDSVEVAVDIGSDTPRIQSNLALLEDVLMNLLSNARDAQKSRQELMKDGKIDQEPGYKPRIVIRAKARVADSMLAIDIEDNGIGMTKEQLDQIFVPFFTTKAGTGKGTGLGLSIIRQMIEHLKGKIEAKSVYGKGSTFTLYLPLAEEPAIKAKE